MIKALVRIITTFILTIGIMFPIGAFLFTFSLCGFFSFINNEKLFSGDIWVFTYMSPSYHFFEFYRLLSLIAWITILIACFVSFAMFNNYKREG